MKRAAVAVVLAALLCGSMAAAPVPARARVLFEEGEYRLELRSAFKGSLLLYFPPTDPGVPTDDTAGGGFFRLRFDVNASLTQYFSAAIAYEQRARASSSPVGSSTLPPLAPAPWRASPLDWVIVDGSPGYLHQHELDRAYLALHLPFLELTVGRQAIGLGRGAIFSAVDIFAPFTPNEVDREWRRGVDAIHAELRIPGVSELSADVIVAFGAIDDDELTTFVALGRIRALVGDVDGSVLLGRRGEDNMLAATLSANIGDAEGHGEIAFYGTDGQGIDGGLAGTDRVVMKALLGASYQIDIGDGLMVLFEYHYSGFGIENVGRDASILRDPAFGARFLRGDSQILGRHALALSLSYPISDEVSASVSYLQSPTDGSGTVAPTVVWNHSDNVTIAANVTIPWGSGPVDGVPTSELGSAPLTIFLQARIYD